MRISPRIRQAMNPSEVLLETRVSGSTVTVVRYAPFQQIRPHAHNEEGLTIVLSGTFLEEAVRGTMLANAGSVATRPYGLRHTNRFGAQGAVILAVIPDREHFDERIRDWNWAEAPVAFRAALRLVARDADALSELLAALGPRKRPDPVLAIRARRLLDDVETRPSVSAPTRCPRRSEHASSRPGRAATATTSDRARSHWPTSPGSSSARPRR